MEWEISEDFDFLHNYKLKTVNYEPGLMERSDATVLQFFQTCQILTLK